MNLNKLKDIRRDRDTEMGNIIVTSGDYSLGFFTTDKGYRLILDGHNMKIISDHYNKDSMEGDKGL